MDGITRWERNKFFKSWSSFKTKSFKWREQNLDYFSVISAVKYTNKRFYPLSGGNPPPPLKQNQVMTPLPVDLLSFIIWLYSQFCLFLSAVQIEI